MDIWTDEWTGRQTDRHSDGVFTSNFEAQYILKLDSVIKTYPNQKLSLLHMFNLI